MPTRIDARSLSMRVESDVLTSTPARSRVRQSVERDFALRKITTTESGYQMAPLAVFRPELCAEWWGSPSSAAGAGHEARETVPWRARSHRRIVAQR
jgi:hypothetical protein